MMEAGVQTATAATVMNMPLGNPLSHMPDYIYPQKNVTLRLHTISFCICEVVSPV
jgi:hypothetical protein